MYHHNIWTIWNAYENTYHHKLAQLEYLRELVAHAADGSQNNTD